MYIWCSFFIHFNLIYTQKSKSISCVLLSGGFLKTRTGDAQTTETGGKPKLQKPWIPPGRLSCRRDVNCLKSQVSSYIKNLKAFIYSSGDSKMFKQICAHLTRQTGLHL